MYERDALAQLIARELGYADRLKTELDDISIYAAEFQTALHESRTFSWIGVVSRPDPTTRLAIDVYLSERSNHEEGDDARHKNMMRVLDSFDDLALSTEQTFGLFLHLIKDTDRPPEQLRAEIEQLCQDSADYKLEFEEVLG